MPAAKKQPKKKPPIIKKPVPPPSASNVNRIIISTASGVIDPVSVLLDNTSIQVTTGYGGWTVTNRNRRVGLTIWEGREPFRMTVPILFDGWRESKSQEVPISRLSRMALPPASNTEPPVIKINGAAVPNPGPVNWVIESLAWGSNVIWDNAANGVLARLRQDCVITLVQYVDEDRIAFKKLGTKVPPASNVAPHGWQASVRVKAGEKSLQAVAKRVYKNAKPNDWKLIQKANGIADPRSIKPNQSLRIPKRS